MFNFNISLGIYEYVYEENYQNKVSVIMNWNIICVFVEYYFLYFKNFVFKMDIFVLKGKFYFFIYSDKC